MIERNTEQVKANIKEKEKEIIRLKFEVSNEGKKLTKDKRIAQ